MFSFANDHIIRVEAYKPELATDSKAVNMSEAKGIQITENTETNGISITPASFHEINPDKTKKKKKKKITVLHATLRMDRGISF